MYHFVAFWQSCNQFAVVKSDAIVDGLLRSKKGAELVNEKILIKWAKKTYLIKVIGTGTKKEMEVLCEAEIEKAHAAAILSSDINSVVNSHSLPQSNSVDEDDKCTSKRTRRRQSDTYPSLVFNNESVQDRKKKKSKKEANRIKDVLEAASASCARMAEVSPNAMVIARDETLALLNTETPVLPATAYQINGNEDIAVIPANDAPDNTKNSKIDKLKAKVAKYKSKIIALQAQNQKLKDQVNNAEGKVELVEGSRVYVEQDDLASLKLLSNNAATLARKLMRQLIPPEKLIGRSLFGLKCNANPGVPLPAIDGTVRDAIINYSLNAFQIKPSANRLQELAYKAAKRQVISSLSKYLNEVRKKHEGTEHIQVEDLDAD